MRNFLKPYAPFAKILLGVISAALVSYGIYDATTMEAMIGGATGLATAFWQYYDTYIAKKDVEEDDSGIDDDKL